MKFYAIAFLIFLGASLVGCTKPAREEYPFGSIPLNKIGLSCSDQAALEVAKKAVSDKYPKLVKKLNANPFSLFESSYDINGGDKKYTYSLKAIFNYYSIGEPQYGNFFEESVEVTMTKDCEVMDVIYFKGKVEIIAN